MSFIAVGSMWVDILNSNLSMLMATQGKHNICGKTKHHKTDL